ncbi:hypothetical protein SIN8267_02660 [Sinobacterium norvegicum]|uniref:Uncharacterized protein n=1 Tax=Sinobacterium norvegicum TaxID=1641715 RepID=A0ABM9AHP6_9GAMM|nr:hypothetical protein [Sinobacterium norvegicum]CAH0992527.1 hypothetical protein SIN8267_02660 [Sinobacterium norvegicum]
MHYLLSPAKIASWILTFFLVVLLAACGDSSSSSSSAVNATTKPADNEGKAGYNALFAGHSFFRPVAEGIPEHVDNVGIEGHSQQVIMSGGASGAPQGLWLNTIKREEIQAILDAGDITLFGMTYHPDYPTLEGYRNWVDYALAQNPDTKFFIALPWPIQRGSTDFDSYESIMVNGHPHFHSTIINGLRTAYPDNQFYCIPYGESAVELYRLYEQGNLPEAERLITSGDEAGIFKDQLGHPETMLVKLSQLVWLQAIYAVDLSHYDYDSGYVTDIKTIAADIMARHDNAYDDQQ